MEFYLLTHKVNKNLFLKISSTVGNLKYEWTDLHRGSKIKPSNINQIMQDLQKKDQTKFGEVEIVKATSEQLEKLGIKGLR